MAATATTTTDPKIRLQLASCSFEFNTIDLEQITLKGVCIVTSNGVPYNISKNVADLLRTHKGEIILSFNPPLFPVQEEKKNTPEIQETLPPAPKTE